jgi:hypothetical protein
MSSRPVLALFRRSAIAGVLAIGALGAWTQGAMAATSFHLATSGGPLVLSVTGVDPLSSAGLLEACVDRTPKLTVTTRGATGATGTAQLQGFGLATDRLAAPGIASLWFRSTVGTPFVVDPSTDFDRETAGSGLIQTVPVPRGYGSSTIYLSVLSQGPLIAGIHLLAASNVVQLHTVVKKDAGADCLSDSGVSLFP